METRETYPQLIITTLPPTMIENGKMNPSNIPLIEEYWTLHNYWSERLIK